MRGLLLSLFLVSVCASAAPHHVPTSGEDQGPEIPTVGSSLFDRIYSKKLATGEVVYDVPRPIDAFVNRLAAQGTEVVHSLFPFSRSLQRPRDLSYDPLLNPRLVFTQFVGFRDIRDPILPGNIMFGYSKAQDEVEVISYNFEAGRFEFQIIRDFSTKPQVFYAQRSKCLSCHQGQAGIFPAAFWEESTSGFGGELILEKLGFDSQEPTTIDNKNKAARILFGKILSTEGTPLVDLAAASSNTGLFDQQLWLRGCQGDRRCRLGLLLKALARDEEVTKGHFEYAQQVLAQSPIVGQNSYGHALSSEGFGLKQVFNKYGGSFSNVVNNPSALLDMIGVLYNLKPEDNPATPRATAISFPNFRRDLNTLFRDTIVAQGVTSGDYGKAILKLYAAGSKIFDEGVLNKIEIMYAIYMEIDPSKAKVYAKWLKPEPTPQKVLFNGPLPPVFREQALNLFARHCAACHASDAVYPAQFLTGTESEVIERFGLMRDKILGRLEHDQMPPRKADRDYLKSSGDYDVLIRFLKSLN